MTDVNDRAHQLGYKEGLARGVRHQRAADRAAFTASARRIDLANQTESRRKRSAQKKETWQGEAWTYFDALPEAKFGARYKGRSLSRLQLLPALIVRPGEDPIPLDKLDAENLPEGVPMLTPAQLEAANAPLERIEESGGLSMLGERWGLNGFVVGEGYIVGYPDSTEPTGERFVFASPNEVTVDDQGDWFYRLDPEDKPDAWVPLPDDSTLMVRVWNQHAQWQNRPDSSLRGVLDVCELLLVLQSLDVGQAYSRLNNGVQLVPRTMLRNPVPRSGEDGEDLTGDVTEITDPVLVNLINTLAEGIENPRTAASAIPNFIAADREDIEAFAKGRVTYDRAFDAIADQRMQAAVKRFATGVDLPAEVITGMADVNHWTAWLITDEAFRAYVEPDAQQLVNALTVGLYRPLLTADTATPLPPELVKRLCVWYDPSNLVADPDATERTFKAHEQMLIGGEAARERLGYEESEAPTEQDRADRATRTPQPGGGQPPAVTPGSGGGEEPATDPAALTAAATGLEVLDGLSRRLANRDRSLMDRLLSLCDAAMMQALNRAGAKARTKAAKASRQHADAVRTVPSIDVVATLGRAALTAAGVTEQDLLAGAFDDVGDRFVSAVAIAQAHTVNDLRAEGLTDTDAAALEADQVEDRNAARALLVAALAALAAARLFSPHPAAPEIGEHDTTMSVPAGLVREALTRAGGAGGTTTEGGAILNAVTSAPAGGVATGETVAQYLAKLHISASAWVWQSGEPSRPFPPHQALDGVEFTAWTQPELANVSGWPAWGHYFPGDHKGCCCLAEPVLVRETVSAAA